MSEKEAEAGVTGPIVGGMSLDREDPCTAFNECCRYVWWLLSDSEAVGSLLTRERIRLDEAGRPVGTLTDHAVDLGWYEYHDIPGKFTTLKRYGHIPAPETLSEFIEVAERISIASDQGITGWRGQSNSQWGVQTGAARRVLQPWSTRESRSLRYIQDALAKASVDTGYDYKRDQSRDEGCFGHRDDVKGYQRHLLDQARRRGFDFVEGRLLSDLPLLGLLQHHGAATNLLDISSSVVVALWFAASSKPEETGVVIAFDEQPMQHIPAKVAEEKSLEKSWTGW